MDPEAITQVLETVKTMNFNVDSATLVQVTEQLKPVVYFYLIKGLVINVIGWSAFIVAVMFVVKAVVTIIKKKE